MPVDPYRPPDSELGTSSGKGLYSIRGILIATILASLAAGIFLIYLNYLNLGYDKLAKLTMRWGVVGYMLIVAAASFVPSSLTFGILFIVLQTGLAGIAADRLQGAAINYHREHGGTMHSSLRAAGIGVLAGVAALFALVFLLTVAIALFGASQ